MQLGSGAVSDRYEKAAGIEKELVALLEKSRPLFLEIGAAGRLLMAGGLDDGQPKSAKRVAGGFSLDRSGGRRRMLGR